MADFTVDTGDLGALARLFDAGSTDATFVATAFRAGAGGIVGGDALGPPEVVRAYQQAFDQWARNLEEIAASMERLSRGLVGAQTLYEAAERHATVSTK